MVAPSNILGTLCTPKRGVNCDTLEATILLGVELAREGREGRKIGTLFTIGDEQAVLRCSRLLILDPLLGHPDSAKRINDPNMRESVKELAQLDGAFVISNEGVVISACRHLNTTGEDLTLPLGLGSRHIAAASITKMTRTVAVVVSSSSVVRVFDDGVLAGEIIPELWMLAHYRTHIAAPYSETTRDNLTIMSREE